MAETQVTLSEVITEKRSSELWDRAEWEEIRKQRLELDSHQCCNCDRSDLQLHVHHIVPDDHGGTDTLGNLRTLCHKCHNKAHAIDEYSIGTSQNPYDSPYVLTIDTLRQVLSTIKHPLNRVVWLILAKTGMGVGELINTKLDDLHLKKPSQISGDRPTTAS